MTTDEIKAMFDAAGIKHRYVRGVYVCYVAIDNPNNPRYETSCKCCDRHTTENESYQCIWNAYLNNNLIQT